MADCSGGDSIKVRDTVFENVIDNREEKKNANMVVLMGVSPQSHDIVTP